MYYVILRNMLEIFLKQRCVQYKNYVHRYSLTKMEKNSVWVRERRKRKSTRQREMEIAETQNRGRRCVTNRFFIFHVAALIK